MLYLQLLTVKQELYYTLFTVSSIYLDKGTICIFSAADQNIFKLQLYNEYGLKVHTLSFNLRVFSAKLEERLRNYSSLICNPLPLFQGTISN